VEKTWETDTATIVYRDVNAKIVGNDSSKFNTIAGFNAGAAELLANTNLATAHKC
jgi:hypothetical protein